MAGVTRYAVILVLAGSLAACGAGPEKMLVADAIGGSADAPAQAQRPKSISSDILAAIALERVTGRPAPGVVAAAEF